MFEDENPRSVPGYSFRGYTSKSDTNLKEGSRFAWYYPQVDLLRFTDIAELDIEISDRATVDDFMDSLENWQRALYEHEYAHMLLNKLSVPWSRFYVSTVESNGRLTHLLNYHAKHFTANEPVENPLKFTGSGEKYILEELARLLASEYDMRSTMYLWMPVQESCARLAEAKISEKDTLEAIELIIDDLRANLNPSLGMEEEREKMDKDWESLDVDENDPIEFVHALEDNPDHIDTNTTIYSINVLESSKHIIKKEGEEGVFKIWGFAIMSSNFTSPDSEPPTWVFQDYLRSQERVIETMSKRNKIIQTIYYRLVRPVGSKLLYSLGSNRIFSKIINRLGATGGSAFPLQENIVQETIDSLDYEFTPDDYWAIFFDEQYQRYWNNLVEIIKTQSEATAPSFIYLDGEGLLPNPDVEAAKGVDMKLLKSNICFWYLRWKLIDGIARDGERIDINALAENLGIESDRLDDILKYEELANELLAWVHSNDYADDIVDTAKPILESELEFGPVTQFVREPYR